MESLDSFKVLLSRIAVLGAIIGQVNGEQFNKGGDVNAFVNIEEEMNFESTLAILGGTIDAREEVFLKRLLFRGTRGQAIVHTFDLKIDKNDILMGENEVPLLGYYVLFRENDALRRIVTRIC